MAIGGEVVGRVTVEADIDTSSMPGQLRRDLRKAADGADAQGAGSRWGRLFVSGVRKEVKSGADDLDNDFFRKIERATGRLPNILGRAFGKGSRNNFLNIIGNMVQGGANLGSMFGDIILGVGKIPAAFRGAQDALEGFFNSVQGFFKNIGEASGTAAKFGSAFSQIGSGVTGALPPMAQLAVAVGVLVAVVASAGFVFLALGEAVAVAVSALSLLAGGVVMVAGAISIGLVGGLLAAVPLMLGLAAAVGVVAIAFSNMSEAQKKSLEPLKKQLGAIGDEVAKTFLRDLPIWIKGASQLLTDFAGPTMQKVASGVRDALTGIVKDFQTPEIRAALAIWGTSIAQIASALTTAFGKGLEGAISFFVPILPYAIQLANYIKDMATAFANWAASAEGQNAIRAFMEKAIPIAEDLWKIIVDVGRAIGSLLTQGSDAGGAGFLDWLSTKAQELREFLDSPQGQNKLSEWFADAKEFGRQLFETLGSVKDTLVALDTPANRAFATNLVTALGKVTEAIGILTPAFQVAGVAMGAMLAIAAKAFGTLLMVIGQVSTKMGEFLVAISVIPGFGWALDAGKNLATMGASAEEAGKKIFAIPDELNILINGDPKDLEAAAAVAMGAIEEVDPTSNTNFVGNTSGINDASAAATRLITGVKPSWMTDFQGQQFDLQRAADESRGAIASVPPDKTSYFKGADTSLGKTVAQANSAITGVPDSHTTYFQGDISGILAKIATARAQISSLMAQSNGLAMGNADLGGASGMILGAAAGTVLKGPRVLLAGEDGPEAIVPLRRPLARVDPSVRGLSALAQGMTGPSGPSISVAEGAIQVTAPNSNPELVAAAVLDRLVARFA